MYIICAVVCAIYSVVTRSRCDNILHMRVCVYVCCVCVLLCHVHMYIYNVCMSYVCMCTVNAKIRLHRVGWATNGRFVRDVDATTRV